MTEIRNLPPGVRGPLIPPVMKATEGQSGKSPKDGDPRPPHDSGLAETLELHGQERRWFFVTDSTGTYGPDTKPTRTRKLLTKFQAEGLDMKWEEGEEVES